MTDPAFEITGHATVLYVKDLPAALAYYRDKLGFTGEFIWGDPPYYACLCRGDAAIHLNSSLPPAAVSVVCVFCKGVDALHDDLVGRGANITRETMTHPYGMRDFRSEFFPAAGRRVGGLRFLQRRRRVARRSRRPRRQYHPRDDDASLRHARFHRHRSRRPSIDFRPRHFGTLTPRKLIRFERLRRKANDSEKSNARRPPPGR